MFVQRRGVDIKKLPRNIRIGSRGSRLALWQAQWTAGQLKKHWSELEIQIIPIKTSGDFSQDKSSVVGNKSQFIKEIEEALLAKKIDLAVHSMKDMPASLPPGLAIAAIPRREDPSDVLIGKNKIKFDSLSPHSPIGTSSIRRKCQLKRIRSDLVYQDIRGNVETRIRKMEEEGLEALVLASAGLKRLGLESYMTQVLPIIPAVGQGALALEARADDEEIAQWVKPLNDNETALCVEAERIFMKTAGGNCQVPLSCYAERQGNEISVRAFISDLEGKEVVQREKTYSENRVREGVRHLALEMLEDGGRVILESLGLSPRGVCP